MGEPDPLRPRTLDSRRRPAGALPAAAAQADLARCRARGVDVRDDLLPQLRTAIPGPGSQALAVRLQHSECPDTTYVGGAFPLFWERARGCNVWDVDANRFVDLTAAFGVCTLGHANPEVTEVLQRQSRELVHAMGDVHPSAQKVRLAEALARLTPGDLEVSIFGSNGSDAIEAALKSAKRATGRPGVVAFEGAYHGVGYGALATTWRLHFRAPFADQLNPNVVHLPYPGHADGAARADAATAAARALERVDAQLRDDPSGCFGAVLVEPILGRGGLIVPHATFLPGLREICDRRGRLLIVDEIFTGLGRTGRWFASEAIVPDLLCVGKSLAGGLPLSVCIGRREVMEHWERSCGEARHTSTFLGNPLACAAALCMLELLERDAWIERVATSGALLGSELRDVLARVDGVREIRGRGYLWGIELATRAGAPDGRRARSLVQHALRQGWILLVAGSEGNVLELAPPFVLGERQRHAACTALRDMLQSLPQSA
ncbi:MAG: aspartate aminotransferase family protein [Candidatus Latescibacterota bacterium]|nr:MAG: aspartate aminotransferase family protein [Candidatus Latescibacterota bacterium]